MDSIYILVLVEGGLMGNSYRDILGSFGAGEFRQMFHPLLGCYFSTLPFLQLILRFTSSYTTNIQLSIAWISPKPPRTIPPRVPRPQDRWAGLGLDVMETNG